MRRRDGHRDDVTRRDGLRDDAVTRRGVLGAGATLGSLALAGCAGLFETRTAGQPAVLEDRPDGVYYPTHTEGMEMVGRKATGDRTVGLAFSYPHRFWTVTGTRTRKVEVREDDAVHLMVSVWDADTETVLPVDSGVTVEVLQDGETVAERSPWPMLSQPMGFHFGDNLQLAGDGSYRVVVDIGATTLARRGGFAGKFGERTSVTFDFEYTRSARDRISYTPLEDQQGQRGAVEPMNMGMWPLSVAPETASLPGRRLGTAESGDVRFRVVALESGGETSLAVCPRTRYNGFVLPMMALSATVQRDGSTVSEGPLRATLDPDLGHHYGATVDGVAAGDEVTVTVDAPPQVSRHEGYETAFFELPPATVTA